MLVFGVYWFQGVFGCGLFLATVGRLVVGCGFVVLVWDFGLVVYLGVIGCGCYWA